CGVEGVVDALTGDAADLLHGVLLAAVGGVGGTRLGGEVEPGGQDVDGDDRDGPRDPCGHHRAEADRAGTYHREGGTHPDVQRTQSRPGTGPYAAAEGVHKFQWGVGAQLDGVAFVGDGVGGEGRLAEEPVVEDAAAVAVGEPQGVGAVQASACEVDGVEVG